MPPQTPKPKASDSNHLTPSFSFGLGLLPSFKFASPRNISLLSSLSPHRFFNRFSKKDDPSHNPDDQHHDHDHALVMDHNDSQNSDIFGLFSPKNKDNDKKKFDIDGDLICTGDSVDLWSLTNDTQTQNMTMNLTSIHEESDKNGLFLSPEELFLQGANLDGSPKLKSSPIIEEKSDKKSRKRKLSGVEESPCKAIAIRIEHASPRDVEVSDVDASKIWTPDLDDVLWACYQKYLRFKDNEPTDSVAFKYTSQNKVLSRMLFNKTGVERTAKQISSRLFRLNKSRQMKSELPTVSPNVLQMPVILSSPIGLEPTGDLPRLSLRDFTLSFVYKLMMQCEHNFARLSSLYQTTCDVLDVSDLKKLLMITNIKHSQDFDGICERLMAQVVPIYSVTCNINFKPSEDVTSTPTSPLTNPTSFSIENGDFLSHMQMRLAPDVSRDNFISWKSSIIIYKDDEKVLLRSRELINGYKNADGTFDIQVPFLNNFWAGYLTFLSNGSKAYNDLKTLQIVHVIYDGDDASYGNIHGYFTYRFDIAKQNPGNVAVTYLRIKVNETDIDDNATVLASPSPTKPERVPLSVDTALANSNSMPSSASIPTYDASLLHKYNPNYNNPDAITPGSIRPSPAHPVYPQEGQFRQSPEEMGTPVSLSAVGRQHSAGQIMHVPAAVGMQSVPPVNFQQGQGQGQFNVQLQQHQPVGYSNFTPSFQGPAMVNDGSNTQYNSMAIPANIPPAPMLSGMAPPQQWGMMFRPEQVISQPPVNSAPASQVQFFPQNNVVGDEPKNASKTTPTITFGPILGYDPSKDMKEHVKRTKSAINVHKFYLNRQVMYKPKKK